VIDEDGKSAQECRVSISHDGEYATAVAMVENKKYRLVETDSSEVSGEENGLPKPEFMW